MPESDRFELLGHVNPVGAYPSVVMPVGRKDGSLVVVYRGVAGRRIETLSPGSEYVQLRGIGKGGTDPLTSFDPLNDCLVAAAPDVIVAYAQRDEAQFISHSWSALRGRRGSAFANLSLVKLTDNRDLIVGELFVCLRQLIRSHPDDIRFISHWFASETALLEVGHTMPSVWEAALRGGVVDELEGRGNKFERLIVQQVQPFGPSVRVVRIRGGLRGAGIERQKIIDYARESLTGARGLMLSVEPPIDTAMAADIVVDIVTSVVISPRMLRVVGPLKVSDLFRGLIQTHDREEEALESLYRSIQSDVGSNKVEDVRFESAMLRARVAAVATTELVVSEAEVRPTRAAARPASPSASTPFGHFALRLITVVGVIAFVAGIGIGMIWSDRGSVAATVWRIFLAFTTAITLYGLAEIIVRYLLPVLRRRRKKGD